MELVRCNPVLGWEHTPPDQLIRRPTWIYYALTNLSLSTPNRRMEAIQCLPGRALHRIVLVGGAA